MTENPHVSRMESICRCGQKNQIRIGDRDFFIGTRKITVSKIPHFYCTYCEKASYDGKLNVDEVLKYAYKNNIDSIDWRKFL